MPRELKQPKWNAAAPDKLIGPCNLKWDALFCPRHGACSCSQQSEAGGPRIILPGDRTSRVGRCMLHSPDCRHYAMSKVT